METLWDLPALAAKAKFASKVDLAKAFWQVGVTPALSELLGCRGPDQQIYLWHCLPFGLSHSPRIFTSITSSFCKAWRHAGITVLVYADDIFILAETLEEHARAVRMVIDDLVAAGVRISCAKAFIQPYTCIDFLGLTVHLDGIKAFSIPAKKAQSIIKDASDLLMAEHVQRRRLLSLLGRLAFAGVACPFISAFRIALVGAASSGVEPSNMSELIKLDQSSKSELEFWSAPLKCRALILDRIWPWFKFAKTRLYAKHMAPDSILPSFDVWGDASDFGAGFNGDTQLSLPTSELLPSAIAGIPIADTSSTARELWVILRLLQLSHVPNGSTLRVFSDNTGAVANANGSSVCSATAPVVRELFFEMLQRNITLYAQWLPRDALADVDACSRNFNSLSHSILPTDSYLRMWSSLNITVPEIELFSCSANRVTGATFFCSHNLEPDSLGDAFSINPARFTSMWAYPPFALTRPLLQWLAHHREELPPTGLCVPDSDFVRAAIQAMHGQVLATVPQILLPPPLFKRSLPSPTTLLFAVLLPLRSAVSRRTRIIPCISPTFSLRYDTSCILAFRHRAPSIAMSLSGQTIAQLEALLAMHSNRACVRLRTKDQKAFLLYDVSHDNTSGLKAALLKHSSSRRLLLLHTLDVDARALIASLGPSLHVIVHKITEASAQEPVPQPVVPAKDNFGSTN
jgi:hypothetical protein